MNYCVKHNEQCDSADASGHCSLAACNRYLLITDENYLKKLVDMQTQIKELIPNSSMDKPTDEEVKATITDIAFLLMGDLQRIIKRSGWPGGVVYNVFMKEFNRMWDERKK